MKLLDAASHASARHLIERVLRDGAPIVDEYPLVFDDAFGGRLVAVGEEGEPRSACAVLARELIAPALRVRGGMIGSVSTDPEWRERGLGTHLLVEAEAALHVQGCALVMLWADDPTFYLERGYCPIGIEHDFLVGADVVERLPRDEDVREMRAGDADAIHALYERHPARVDRSAVETGALLRCPGMTTLVIDRDGGVAAYACMGRGSDLHDAVHEWGGSAEDVLALLRAHFEGRFPDPTEHDALFLMAPPSAEELTRRLDHLGAVGRRGILALGKILDRGAAAEAVTRALEPEGRLEATAHGFAVHGPAGSGALDDDAVLALLVPVDEVRDGVRELLKHFGFAGARLPVEPFVWGLDSI